MRANPIETWMLVLLFIATTALGVAVLTSLLDWFVGRASTSQAQKDVDELFRRDRARDVMRSWTEDES